MNIINTQVIVLGAGATAYAAAFRCADLGLDVVLVSNETSITDADPHTFPTISHGGAETVKKQAQLQLAKSIMQIKHATDQGICFNNPVIDLAAITAWQDNTIKQFATELQETTKARNITLVNGIGQFRASHTLTVEPPHQTCKAKTDAQQIIHFDYAIISTDTQSGEQTQPLYRDNRFWTPTDARALETVPQKLLVIGDDPTALEMATIYHALGTDIDFVTSADQPFPELDKDINRYYQRSVKEQAKVCQNAFNIKLKTDVAAVSTKTAPDEDDGVYISVATKGKISEPSRYDAVLNATGLQPATKTLNLKTVGVTLNEQGFICVDEQIKTNVAHIYAAGSVARALTSPGQDLTNSIKSCSIAHRRQQGRLAAEAIAGHYQSLPVTTSVTPCSITYTVPTVAWVGNTEKTLQDKEQDHKTVSIPWRAMGRANTDACTGGLTKLIFDKHSGVLLGGGIVGNHADEMISEIGLAVNKGFTAQDMANTIHAHPTLYESVALAAERYLGTATDVLNT